MILEGKVWKSNHSIFWLGEIPLLDLVTQAETKEEVPEMVKDAIEGLVNNEHFSVKVVLSEDQLFIESNDPKRLVSLMLKRQRNKMGLTQEQVAKNLNCASANDYAQYEQAKHMPSIEKLEEILRAIDPKLKLYFSASGEDTTNYEMAKITI
jgi:DNA-binding XRE family transcriptional regulator